MAVYPEISPELLELEILETSALEDVTQVSELMNRCLQMGIKFSLDDFGTGYSSLTHLKRLPADFLKIDQSFVQDMLTDSSDLTIVKAVIGLAHAFNRSVITEGVETNDQQKLNTLSPLSLCSTPTLLFQRTKKSMRPFNNIKQKSVAIRSTKSERRSVNGTFLLHESVWPTLGQAAVISIQNLLNLRFSKNYHYHYHYY